jgi:hypothetical protein
LIAIYLSVPELLARSLKMIPSARGYIHIEAVIEVKDDGKLA